MIHHTDVAPGREVYGRLIYHIPYPHCGSRWTGISFAERLAHFFLKNALKHVSRKGNRHFSQLIFFAKWQKNFFLNFNKLSPHRWNPNLWLMRSELDKECPIISNLTANSVILEKSPLEGACTWTTQTISIAVPSQIILVEDWCLRMLT